MRRLAVALRLGPLAAVLACTAPRAPEPPLAEFVVSAGDSSYWARVGGGDRELQRVPMVLTRLGDRFQELYTTDDDYSYQDAVFVGQSVWRRDLEGGDSLRLLTDSEPARLADRWGDLHPDSRPLGDDDPDPDQPAITVTTTIDFLDAAGPFVGIARHLDVARGEEDGTRTTDAMVLDVRRGGVARDSDLVAATTAALDSGVAPSPTADGALRWRRGALLVDAVPDSGTSTARLVVSDGHHRWPLGAVPMPVRRLYWLDHVSAAQKRALERAFGEASLYDENVRTASAVAPLRPPHTRTPRA